MKTINTYILAGTLLLAGAFLAGCSKATDSLQPEAAQKPEAEEEILTPEVPQGPNEFILKVSSINTKALADLGETLGSEWTQGDSVRVYNVTTEQNIEGWLFAEAGGTTTTFSGTVAGNFNQGDVLRLSFLSPNYFLQDGTLEGVASQCDCALADVEILEIDPEAKTITTEVAEFVKQQAVVKFNLTNRKNPVEDLEVESFNGYGILPGTETPFGIRVNPAAATNELYVAIPYLEDMEITFEALGADGYYYRLIVPSVTFEDGLYYRRTLNMKRKALVKAPVAKTNLKYTSQPLALVDSAHVYWTVNNQEVILDDDKDYQEQKCVISYFVKKEVTAGTTPTAPTATENGWMTSIPTQTHAGTYYVWTKMTGNYDYEDVDVCENPEKVVIAKGTVTVDVSAVSGDLVFNTQQQNLLSAAAKIKLGTKDVTTATDDQSKACVISYYVSSSNSTATGGSWGTSYSAKNPGTWYVWVKVTGNGDINDVAAASKVSKYIDKATPTVTTTPTARTGLVYNGAAQNLANAGSTNGGTLKYSTDNVNWSNNVPTGTNAGSYTVYWKVVGNDYYYDKSGGNFTVTIAKANGWVTLSSYSHTFNKTGLVQFCSFTVNSTSGGSFSLSGNPSGFIAQTDGNTVTIVRTGSNVTVTYTVSTPETANYKAATATFTCYKGN
jgi:hypothetical protein